MRGFSRPPAWVSLLALASCATAPHPGPTYIRADLARLGSAELAGRFLLPEEVARIDRHAIEPPWGGPDTYWRVILHARPRPLGDDLCEQTTFFVALFPLPGRPANAPSETWPARLERDGHPYPDRRLALAPNCQMVPGQLFARLAGVRTTFGQGAEMLRALSAARDAAAGAGPLPFRLSCVNWSRGGHFECPADLRATLATLPLHQALTLERQPFPSNCDTSERDEGDAVEIDDPETSDVWDVRLRHMGTDQAELVMIRRFARTRVKC